MREIFIPSILILLVASSCSKAPQYGGSGRGAANGSDQVVSGPNGNEPLEGTTELVSDKYKSLECTSSIKNGFRAWRRLSNVEFKNTVASVFGVKDSDYDALPDDIGAQTVYDTSNDAANFVNPQRFRNYYAIAEKIANKADVSKLFPCLAQGSACMSSTLPTLGSLAWRRPLTDVETKALTQLFSENLTDIAAEASARVVIRALVMSQAFLYRSELGQKGSDSMYTLTDWEMASALSYTILRMPPDETLRKLAATKGGLSSPAAIKAQVDRLMVDAQAKVGWTDFANQWMDARSIINAEVTETQIPSTGKKEAAAEVGALFADVFSKSTGSTLGALLNADSVPSSSSLASSVYSSAVADNRIAFKEPERRGLLGLAAFLASHSHSDATSPAKRGAFVVQRLMCTGFAPTGAFTLPERKTGQTNKARFLELEANAGCMNCHKPMNQFGFLFENFDMIGRFRTKADNEDVTVSSTISIDGSDVLVNSPSEFSEALSKSMQGQECFSRQIFRYVLGRRENSPIPMIGADPTSTVFITRQTEADNCMLKSMTDTMNAQEGNLKAPIVTLLTSDAFRRRVDRAAQK